MNRITLTIPGSVCAAAKPAIDTRGGKVRIYTRPAAVSFRYQVRRAGIRQGVEPILEGPVEMSVRFILHRPKYRTTRANRRNEDFRIQRPDLGNLLWVLLDALQGVAYRDDAQVVRIARAVKIEHHGSPKTEVIITPIRRKS